MREEKSSVWLRRVFAKQYLKTKWCFLLRETCINIILPTVMLRKPCPYAYPTVGQDDIGIRRWQRERQKLTFTHSLPGFLTDTSHKPQQFEDNFYWKHVLPYTMQLCASLQHRLSNGESKEQKTAQWKNSQMVGKLTDGQKLLEIKMPLVPYLTYPIKTLISWTLTTYFKSGNNLMNHSSKRL